ncbi:MAG: protein-disulfide isomerase [Oceanicoccus sp.]|jgi:protein-disulfide isomerase
MDNQQTAFVGLSFLAIGLMIGLVFSNGLPVSDGGQNEPDDFGAPETEFVSVSEDDDAFLGDADAPVVIVEFSDYQCPYCASFQSETLPLLKENYIDTGLVKLVYRDFPIPSHENAFVAAVAAECVAEEGGNEAYFEMHDMIFENMESWFYSEDAGEVFTQYASELGYDIATCLDDPAMAAEVEADYVAGRSYGVGGTPTFFINGKKLVGAYPYDVFVELIESEL